ncbi:NUDIX domain-containing protein [Kitasatospora sp. NPDC006697]|uniref:NUDIX hydrolase n=1 Tax=Kitasatospora sp. NPDC006697 TaxID=3364020 RepID=UPI003694035D
MIVWVNGSFGAGKTSACRELVELLPDSRLFEPAEVGAALRQLLPERRLAEVAGFQELPSWRRLVPEVAAALLSEVPGTLVVPMTLLREEYRDEIFGALAARGLTVHHFVLHAEETILHDGEALAAYRAAQGWLHRDARVVDTTGLTPRQVAETLAELVKDGSARCPIVRSAPTGADTVAAAVLLFDEQDRVVLVDPVYKPAWEFPGGVVERGEAPTDAAVREVAEELGLQLEPAALRLLAVDWEPATDGRRGGLRLVYDGGRLTPGQRAALRLPPDELRAWRAVTPEEAADLLPPNRHRRLTAALTARTGDAPHYLEAGTPAALGPGLRAR